MKYSLVIFEAEGDLDKGLNGHGRGTIEALQDKVAEEIIKTVKSKLGK